MDALSQLQPGTRLYDRRTGRERIVHQVERRGRVVFISFLNPQTGNVDRQPFAVEAIAQRFELLDDGAAAFGGDPEIVRLVAEAHRLQHAYLFNPLFATETSLIDLLPHQLAAVYGVPPTGDDPQGRPGMLDQPCLRFLLADDAGAGKTIMAGLLIREMLLRRLVRRVLVVPPAGLVGNWERELRILFRLRFHILSSADAQGDNPFADARNNLAIVSVDTLWRERVRQAYLSAPPYDLVVFDEAHKLSAWRDADLTVQKTRRYEMGEQIARQGRHLLLMTATPHMGKDDPYYLLWRLLEPELLSTPEAFGRLTRTQKRRYLLRRMKEEMVRFDGAPIFPPRYSRTIAYPLTQGEGQEQDLYNQVTAYCQTYYDRARLRNRSAAGLAMSILQRRLASSTWSLFRSLERRAIRLDEILRALESGLTTLQELEARQSALPTTDVRDLKTGDEEESEGGQEESERQDEEAAAATTARTVEELRAELAEVRRLARMARQVYDCKRESKFEKLWEVLEGYPDGSAPLTTGTKVLIFTEFRDTLDFLIGRLEGKGLTGQIAQIHGGMDYRERERQVALFRSHGVRVMVATDAAGEGINLQFCWLLINYDIPWNPARLEQRMGRVHRYKQTHDVLLLNMVSQDTREGRVLKVLLDKLEVIRRELESDKVFDIIGRQFSGKPLAELIFEAVVEGKEEEARRQIEQTLETSQAQAHLYDLERKVETSQVKAMLEVLRDQREVAEMRRMMPAYVRRFFQLAAPAVGVGIRGDVEGVFALQTGLPEPCPASVARALEGYPEGVRDRLTFDREQAMPDLAQEPRAIYLHPGEPVYEAVMDLFLGQYGPEGMRGATFYDPDASEPYLFYLARAQVLRDPAEGEGSEPEIVEEQMTGVRCYADGRMEQAPAHLLLTLYPQQPQTQTRFFPKNGFVNGFVDIAAVEACLVETVALPALQARREREEGELPARRERLRVAYNLWQAGLFRQRRLLREAAERGVPAARSKLRACQAELDGLDRQRREAEAALYAAVDALRLGPVSIYAQALALPLPPEEAERRRDVDAERVALDEVVRRERAEGSTIEDVSDPHLKAGFDLKVLRAGGTMRYVEVKGRSGVQAIEMEANEWAQAANHRDRYWLYVVYHCDAVPQLYRVPDPFGQLVARQTGAVRIQASEVFKAARQ